MDSDIYQQVDTDGRPVRPMDDLVFRQKTEQTTDAKALMHWQVFLAVLPAVIALNRDGTDIKDDTEFALAWTDEAMRQYRVPEPKP